MLINLLFENPALFVAGIVAIVVSLTIHEFAHALVAQYHGDDTAQSLGRLTLNPLAHLDPLGFAMLLVSPIGWAKPVPVNVYNLRNPRFASAMVSLAGPISNLLAIIIFIIAFRLLVPTLGGDNLLTIFLILLIQINTMLMVFNLLPIPPLDGSKVLFSILPDSYNGFKEQLSVQGPIILLGLVIVDNLMNLGIFRAIFGWVFGFVGLFLA
jgi:Zn-dependent protease